MPKALLKKVLISLLLACYLLVLSLANVSLVSRVSAQTPAPNWYNQDFKNWYIKVYDSPTNDVFGERYTAAQVEWIFYGLLSLVLNGATGDPKLVACILKGGSQTYQNIKNAPVVGGVLQRVVPQPIQQSAAVASCGIDKFFRNLSATSYQQNSSTGIADFILFTDRPLSGITYFRNVGRSWHLIPEARAQATQVGFGFSALNPILPIWRASRNVAYGILVFAILILSFMIMFRVKINPQTVITVQSAIPKIVIALILITFSYAIAGFMVDLMYTVIGFFSLILSNAYGGGGNDILGIKTSVTGFFDYMTKGPVLPGQSSPSGIFGAFSIYVPAFVTTMLFAFLGTSGILIGLFGLLLTPLILLVLIAILLFVIVKTLWTLLKAFAYVILLVIFAPLQIALGVVVPGVGFGTWLRSLASNLAVFPVAGLFISLAFLFLVMSVKLTLGDILSGNTIANIFVGTFNANQVSGWPPLLGVGTGAGQGLVFLGVSLVMLLILPKVSDIIKAVIEGKPFEYGTAIGEAAGPIMGAVGLGRGAVGRGITGFFGEEIQARLGRRFGKVQETESGKVTREGIKE